MERSCGGNRPDRFAGWERGTAKRLRRATKASTLSSPACPATTSDPAATSTPKPDVGLDDLHESVDQRPEKTEDYDVDDDVEAREPAASFCDAFVDSTEDIVPGFVVRVQPRHDSPLLRLAPRWTDAARPRAVLFGGKGPVDAPDQGAEGRDANNASRARPEIRWRSMRCSCSRSFPHESTACAFRFDISSAGLREADCVLPCPTSNDTPQCAS